MPTPAASYNVRSGSDGEFSREGFVGGNYTVSIDSPGFKRTVMQNVRPGRDIEITLQVGGISEVVEVTAGTATIDASSSRMTSTFIDGRKVTTVSEALTSTGSGIQTAAIGEELGDLFEYQIERPITVPRDRSALIPIIQTKMDGERVSIYNETVRTAQ